MKKRFTPPDICPVCGEEVPRNAVACLECGADERSGWKEDADVYDGLDLPDEAYGDTSYVRREFRGPPKPHVHGIWIATAVLLILASLLAALRWQ